MCVCVCVCVNVLAPIYGMQSVGVVFGTCISNRQYVCYMPVLGGKTQIGKFFFFFFFFFFLRETGIFTQSDFT